MVANLAGAESYTATLQYNTAYRFRVFNAGGNGYAAGNLYTNEAPITTGSTTPTQTDPTNLSWYSESRYDDDLGFEFDYIVLVWESNNGGNARVERSSDGGATWEIIDENLGNLSIASYPDPPAAQSFRFRVFNAGGYGFAAGSNYSNTITFVT
jgi:hypothetical protein